MGKGKRNRSFRELLGAQNGHDRATSEAAAANAEVREAEANLLKARQRAAAAAQAHMQAGRDAGITAAHRTARDRVRKAHLPISLDDAAGRDPQDQANAFFNRPGDYFLARFAITSSDPELAGQEPPIERAETVLKASEDQFDYLLEVLRQIRGGFGERCRIELFRTHTVQQQPVPGAARSDYQPRNEPGHFPEPQVRVAGGAGPLFDDRPGRDLTRDEIQQQLPGMTRAQAAAELGVRPDDIGGTFQATGDMQREELAAELGVAVESLQPIAMSDGGNAYAITPEAREPQGRHARPDVDTSFDCISCGQRQTVDTKDGWRCLNCGASDTAATTQPEHVALDWAALANHAWSGAGWYVIYPADGQPFNRLCDDLHVLETALRAAEATSVRRAGALDNGTQETAESDNSLVGRHWAGPGIYFIEAANGRRINKRVVVKDELTTFVELINGISKVVGVYKARPVADNPQA